MRGVPEHEYAIPVQQYRVNGRRGVYRRLCRGAENAPLLRESAAGV